MQPTSFASVCARTFVTTCFCFSALAAERPNFVLFLTDDQPHNAFGFLNSDSFVTPSMDRIAREGAYFSNAHVAATVSASSRAAIFFGQYASHSTTDGQTWEYNQKQVGFGNEIPDTHSSIGKVLSDAGYNTAYAGKVDGFSIGLLSGTEAEKHTSLVGRMNDFGFTFADAVYNGNVGDSQYHNMEWITLGAIRALDRFAADPADKPFFIAVNPTLPHGPSQFSSQSHSIADTSTSSKGILSAIDLSEIQNVQAPRSTIVPRVEAANLTDNLETNYTPTMGNPAATMLWIDDSLTAIIDKLTEMGELENTYILFISDHGFGGGSEGEIWNTGCNMPLLVRGPGVRSGRTINAAVSAVDIAATIYDLAGTTPPSMEPQNGTSFSGLLDGSEDGKDRTALVEIGFTRALIRGSHKLIGFRIPQPLLDQAGGVNPYAEDVSGMTFIDEKPFMTHFGAASPWTDAGSGGSWDKHSAYFAEDQLYDIAVDPGETNNLAGNPAYAGILADMKRRMARSLAESEGSFPDYVFEVAVDGNNVSDRLSVPGNLDLSGDHQIFKLRNSNPGVAEHVIADYSGSLLGRWDEVLGAQISGFGLSYKTPGQVRLVPMNMARWRWENDIAADVAEDADPDGNGFKLLEEYMLDIPPGTRPLRQPIEPVFDFTTNEASLSYRARRPEAGYQVEISTDLRIWSGDGVSIQDPVGNALYRDDRVKATFPIFARNGFARLQLTSNGGGTFTPPPPETTPAPTPLIAFVNPADAGIIDKNLSGAFDSDDVLNADSGNNRLWVGRDSNQVRIITLPILLPNLPSGTVVKSAKFEIQTDGLFGDRSSFNIDLYGLNTHRATPQNQGSDFNVGSDSENALIQTGFANNNTQADSLLVTTNSALLAWINARYQAGAAGSYVFLRLSPDQLSSAIPEGARYTFDSAEDDDDEVFVPRLTIGIEPPDVPILRNDQKASRFLRQATFGGTRDEIQTLAASIASLGETQALEAWIDNQFSLSPSLHENLLRDITSGSPPFPVPTHLIFTNRGNSWLTIALKNPDQLRQRTAWALSQILVTSGLTDTYIRRNPYGASNYYDVLVNNAFGSYRTLLYDVARHPIMGRYLSHAGNKKANASLNTFPDENFAREIMQLFSIGLVELNDDGSLKLDSNGNAIETYDNDTIQEFAKIFTGLNYNGKTNLSPLYLDMSTPMVAKDADHDMSAKTLLKGLTTSAGQDALSDLDAAIGNLFNHPNVGPFIGKLLIQRFTTSNPSFSYISAVSAAFNNNGSGVRGDMKAVMKAILLNPEARTPADMADPEHGKLNETLLSYLALGRAFNVTTDNAADWLITFDNPSGTLGIGPFNSPSVFNFYPVDYRPQGPVTDAGLVGPEFGVLNSSSTIAMFNLFRDVTGGKIVNNKWVYLNTTLDSDAIYLDVSPEISILSDTQDTDAKNNSDLLDHIELLLVTGKLNTGTRSIILAALNAVPDKQQRVQTAIYLVALSPEFQILR